MDQWYTPPSQKNQAADGSSNTWYTAPSEKQSSVENVWYTPPSQKQHAVTQGFGNTNPQDEVFSGGINTGTDFDFKPGTPVNAPKGQWEVKEAFSGDNQHGHIGDSTNQGYGNSIVLHNTQTGEEVRLSHLSKEGLKQGQQVKGGQEVGLSGDTGNVTGPHLDVEYYDKNGKLADITKTPYSY